MINFDANATYGLCETSLNEAVAQVRSALNPSSVHVGGQRARGLIEDARDAVRKLVGASSDYSVVFCSGATEANNLALHQARIDRREVITSRLEHPSVIASVNELSSQGYGVKFVEGEIVEQILQAVQASDPEQKLLVSCMLANNETGEVFDVRQLVAALGGLNRNLVIHSDGVQLCGKGELDIQSLGVDCISLSGHKLGALAGVGALVCRPNVRITPQILGGPQEVHRRAGTENLLGIINFGICAEKTLHSITERVRSMCNARDYFESQLKMAIAEVEILGESAPRIPNTSCFRIPGFRGDDVVVAMDVIGFCISSGAACASGKQDASPVLRAMGYHEDTAKEFLRVSFRHDSNQSDINAMIAGLRAYMHRSEFGLEVQKNVA